MVPGEYFGMWWFSLLYSFQLITFLLLHFPFSFISIFHFWEQQVKSALYFLLLILFFIFSFFLLFFFHLFAVAGYESPLSTGSSFYFFFLVLGWHTHHSHRHWPFFISKLHTNKSTLSRTTFHNCTQHLIITPPSFADWALWKVTAVASPCTLVNS